MVGSIIHALAICFVSSWLIVLNDPKEDFTAALVGCRVRGFLAPSLPRPTSSPQAVNVKFLEWFVNGFLHSGDAVQGAWTRLEGVFGTASKWSVGCLEPALCSSSLAWTPGISCVCVCVIVLRTCRGSLAKQMASGPLGSCRDKSSWIRDCRIFGGRVVGFRDWSCVRFISVLGRRPRRR